MSAKNYYLRYKDKIIGKFIENGKHLTYLPISNMPEELDNALGYPVGLFKKKPKSTGFIPMKDKLPTRDDIEFWLEDRVFPPDRQNSSDLLKAMSLSIYDRWEIVKKINAITMFDQYWLSDQINDSYYNIHPLGKIEKKSEVKNNVGQGVKPKLVVKLKTTSGKIKKSTLPISKFMNKQGWGKGVNNIRKPSEAVGKRIFRQRLFPLSYVKSDILDEVRIITPNEINELISKGKLVSPNTRYVVRLDPHENNKVLPPRKKDEID